MIEALDIGFAGRALIWAAFLGSLATLAFSWLAASREGAGTWKLAPEAPAGPSGGAGGWGAAAVWAWALKGAALLGASGLLLHLLLTHQFQYYYVWNYTSLDLLPKYLLSAFYGGQEGSFLLWIVISWLIGLGLLRWTRAPYRWPVLFVMAFTQAFLLSMLLGWNVGDLTIGASPFRTIVQEMPDAPFLRANPDFVPADGRGLNDLLKSPWMMIHPPILFVGFAMMTVPFAFAIASLWTRTYHEWVRPALPWTLAANVSLLTAIFLGGYWAYETLSFGGYWAWDPVENASLVPWLIGTAGIHTMIIQTRSARAHKASLFFAIFAYILIVYETFLTRSGVLANASVHSFVDLGLYNQLLAFMLAMAGLGLGAYFYRYRELPSPKKESAVLSAEFLTFTGAMFLLVLGLVIILGTSSPIIGRLFYENPTPPEISFYNDWSAPIALLMGVLTVVGQIVFWKRQTWESLSGEILAPLALTTVASVASVMLGNVRDLYSIVFLFISWFTVFGNGAVMLALLRRDPKLVGGTLTHIGFGVLLLGVLASSKYATFLVPPQTEAFNQRVMAGEAFDEDGFPIVNRIESFELKRNQPVVLNQRYMVTYEGYELQNAPRPGTQVYSIRFQPLDGGKEFTLRPEVYPMMGSIGSGRVDWSVDPDIRTGWASDLYLYVGGSALVERRNEEIDEANAAAAAGGAGAGSAAAGGVVSAGGAGAGSAGGGEAVAGAGVAGGTSSAGGATASAPAQGTATALANVQALVQSPAPIAGDTAAVVKLVGSEPVRAGDYLFRFLDYAPAQAVEVPPTTQVGIRAVIDVEHVPTGRRYEVVPLFSVFIEEGENLTYSPPLRIEEWGLEVQFSSVVPDEGAIELTVAGLDRFIAEDWIYVTAEKKPFVSMVWLGTFLLMGGFSVSIIRHWRRDRDANRQARWSGRGGDGSEAGEEEAAVAGVEEEAGELEAFEEVDDVASAGGESAAGVGGNGKAAGNGEAAGNGKAAGNGESEPARKGMAESGKALLVMLAVAGGVAVAVGDPLMAQTPDKPLSALDSEPSWLALQTADPAPSPRAALLRSLAVPGWGHLAIGPDHAFRGRLHMAAETAMLGGVIRAIARESSLQTEYATLASLRAGVSIDGRSRSFLLAMADYPSLAAYNEQMLRSRNWDRLIDDIPENRWDWASEQDRKAYGSLRSDADRFGRQVPALLSFMVVNRVVSALSAYNRARREAAGSPDAASLSFRMEPVSLVASHAASASGFSRNALPPGIPQTAWTPLSAPAPILPAGAMQATLRLEW